MRSRESTVLLLAVVVASLMAPTAALANMAPPGAPGDALGEPGGELAGLHIEREDLALDLRPLADAGPVHVSATYRVRNDGEARSVELVFVADAMAETDISVMLDGSAIEFSSERIGGMDPPAGIPWRPPSTTPGLDGGTVPYGARYEGLLRFTLELGPGQHEIAVRYMADATAYSTDSPARLWQLGYVLAPAREWASFGTLDISVQLPAGWNFASSPALQRTGDEARGSFEGVPADALGLTTQFPIVRSEPVSWLFVGIASAIGVALAALVGIIIGRRAGRPRSAWPISLSYSLAAAFVVLFLRGVLPGAVDAAIPSSQRSSAYFAGLGQAIGDALLLLISFPVLVMVLFLLMQLAATLAARWSGRGRGAAPSLTG